jgi:putative transposase/transposase-like zinc-binding protein
VTTPALELADIFRLHGPAYLARFGDSLSFQQKRALRDIALCRTAALGGHVNQCDECGHRTISYCSCRNRHCPKCRSAASAAWLEGRAAELLPVEYFHVVFTLPQSLGALALQNQRLFYGILFRAASETLLQIGADPKHLGARIGFLAVLHTWGQNLHYHPHLHCVIPGGGIAADDSRWISCRRQFLFPIKVLSRLFRAKFNVFLKAAFRDSKLGFYGELKLLGEKRNFIEWLTRVAGTEWVVYAKPPFGGPRQVLKYLARYTHRVAISNRRLVALQNGSVTFRWKDYTQGNKPAMMTLQATEFIRRFLLHVLPKGLVRIRHFGFFANRCRRQNISLCRKLLDVAQRIQPQGSTPRDDAFAVQQESQRCPVCKTGRLQRVEVLPPQAPALPGCGSRLFAVVLETNTS